LITIVTVAISYLASAGVPIPCNSFPKIFGSASFDSWINQIDVFDDYLAFGGRLEDNINLASFSSMRVPYIILSSILTNYYYWSKAFVQILDHEMVGLQFNTDGKFIIAHTFSGASTTSVILVIDVDSGEVITARNY
jgi:hypothetical protein